MNDEFQVGDLIRFVDDQRTGPRKLRGELAIIMTRKDTPYGIIYELRCESLHPGDDDLLLWTSEGSNMERV
jgi:hypothetical protein